VNHLEVRVEEDEEGTRRLTYLVDGVDLRGIAIEEFGDGGEDWIGPPAELVRRHPDHLWGGPDQWEDDREPWYDFAAVLGCSCGQPGDNAVLAEMTIGSEHVTWRLIRSGSRRVGRSLVFTRKNYDAALGWVFSRTQT
jgi:hypothetical protein